MTEPDVALTDYGLAIECAVFAWLLYRGRRGGELRVWTVLFFASLAIGSACGGTVHGFFLDETSRGYRALWPLALLAIGVTALCGWAIGANLVLGAEVARWVRRAAILQLALYSWVVLFVTQEFWVAIADYLPAVLFLLAAFGILSRRGRGRGAALGAWGLGLTLVAAAIQQLEIPIHPLYFNHNALYHAVQALALGLLFLACRGALAGEG